MSLTLKRYNAQQFSAVLSDENNDPKDLTGKTVKFRMKQAVSNADYLIDATATLTDATAGLVTVALDGEDTGAIPRGSYPCEFYIEDDDQSTDPMLFVTVEDSLDNG